MSEIKKVENSYFCLSPDFEFGQKHQHQQHPHPRPGEFHPGLTFHDLCGSLRRAVLSSSASRRPLTTSMRQTEKSWFQFAQKSWEGVKNSSFYMEYNRLL